MHLNLAILTALRLLVIIRKVFHSPNLRKDYPMFSSTVFTSFFVVVLINPSPQFALSVSYILWVWTDV